MRLRRKLRKVLRRIHPILVPPRFRTARSRGVETKSARAATREGDWFRACEEWRRVIDQAGGEAPPESWVRLAQALAKLGSVRDAMATVVEGRQAHPEHERLLVEQARLAQRLYKHAEEDERHQWKALLLDAHESLVARRASSELSKSAMKVIGKTSMTLRRWSDAAEIWAHVAANDPDEREDALLQQAVAHRQAGETSEALSILESFAPDAMDTRYRAEFERLSQRQGRGVADDLATHIRMRVALGDPSVIREVVPVALATRGEPAPLIRDLIPVVEDLQSFVEVVTSSGTGGGRTSHRATIPKPPPSAVSPLRDPAIVLVSGFLYSGSGAVFDFLRDLDGMTVPFDDRETGFLKKPGNFGVLFDPDAESHFEPASIVDMVLSSVFGLNQSGRPLLGTFRESDDGLDYLIRSVRSLIAEFLDTWGRRDACAGAQVAVRTFLDGVISHLTPPGQIALLNNAVIGHQLARLRAFSGARVVAVIRDPRDQYVSQKLESPYAMSCKDFITMMQHRYAALVGSQESPVIGGRVSVVRFEDFVQDPEIRAMALESLALSHLTASSERSFFRPEISRTNIGIHQGFSDQDEVEQVAEGLLSRYEGLATLQ